VELALPPAAAAAAGPGCAPFASAGRAPAAARGELLSTVSTLRSVVPFLMAASKLRSGKKLGKAIRPELQTRSFRRHRAQQAALVQVKPLEAAGPEVNRQPEEAEEALSHLTEPARGTEKRSNTDTDRQEVVAVEAGRPRRAGAEAEALPQRQGVEAVGATLPRRVEAAAAAGQRYPGAEAVEATHYQAAEEAAEVLLPSREVEAVEAIPPRQVVAEVGQWILGAEEAVADHPRLGVGEAAAGRQFAKAEVGQHWMRCWEAGEVGPLDVENTTALQN